MGIGGISIWQLLIILVIVLLLFGTKRLKNLGGDLGGAIKGFKKAISEDSENNSEKDADPNAQKKVVNENTSTAEKSSADASKTETKQS